MIKKIFTVSVVVLTIFWAVGLAAFVPTAQAVAIASGDLIKASQPAVYYYGADGKRYVFPNEKTYKTWYADFSGVKTITDGELAAITIGGNVTMKPGVKLGKITTDPRVYAIAANGSLREIASEAVAAALYGSAWATLVQDISDAFFTNYSIGAKINAAADYDVAAVTAAAQSINVDKGLAGIVTTGGNLQISLAVDTPATATVSTGAQSNFTKITLSAGSTAVKVVSMYITRSGLTNNADINNITLVGSDGAAVGNSGSLNTNSKALITFVPNLAIAANTSVSYYIRASVAIGAGASTTAALGVATATDIVLDAGTATGTFPIAGNFMSIVNLAGTIGTANVGQDAAVVPQNVDAGAKRVLTSEFYVQAGANEDLSVESLSLIKAGTANTTDSGNIELYSLTEARTLGTVASWNANSRVVFSNLHITIPKGAKHTFQVYLDVFSGSGQVIDVDLTDGGNALVTVKGQTYGFYLTPVIIGGWLGEGVAGVGGQTVNAGNLNISKSTASPATGLITQASEQKITTWDFEVRGEAAKITNINVTLLLGGGMGIGALSNARIYDETGTLVAGPKAVTVNPIVFTDTIIVPTGTHKYSFGIDILNAAPNTSTIRAGIAVIGDITATGMNTNNTMVVAGAPANGNVQTVQSVALSVPTLTQPASRNVSLGTQAFLWATASLDATNSGEDVRVSSVSVTDVFVAGGDFTDIRNLTIWADLTTASSSRGDAYETQVSNVEQPAAGASPSTKAINLSQVITVPKGTYVKIAVVGDLATGATCVSHKLRISAVTGTGKSTGNVPGTVYTGAGQIMTLQAAGTLASTVLSSSSPAKQLLISGATKQTVGVYKLTAQNIEDLDLNQVVITDTGATPAINAISKNPVAGVAITGIVVAGAVVTVTAAGHTIPVGVTVNGTIAGAIWNATCNGTYPITSTGVNTFTYATPNVACVTSANVGTVTFADVIVTTAAAHGLLTGDTVKIGGSNSTPSIDGTYIVLVNNATNFEITPAAPVTVVGTLGNFAQLNRIVAGLGAVAQSWYLYSNIRSDGGSTADPVGVASGGSFATFVLANNTVKIPANGSVTLTVKIDVAPVDGTTIVNQDPFRASILEAGDILVTGKSSGIQTDAGTVLLGLAPFVAVNAVGNKAYTSRPTFSLNSLSPNGTLVPSVSTVIGIYNIAADAADDITFEGPGGAGNSLTVTISAAYAAGDAGIENIILKDQDGNILDTVAIDINTTALGQTTPVPFIFATRDLVIPKGTSQKVYVIADTTDFTAVNDLIQVVLDDNAPTVPSTMIDWSVNFDGGNYDEGDVIFRGDIAANALQR